MQSHFRIEEKATEQTRKEKAKKDQVADQQSKFDFAREMMEKTTQGGDRSLANLTLVEDLTDSLQYQNKKVKGKDPVVLRQSTLKQCLRKQRKTDLLEHWCLMIDLESNTELFINGQTQKVLESRHEVYEWEAALAHARKVTANNAKMARLQVANATVASESTDVGTVAKKRRATKSPPKYGRKSPLAQNHTTWPVTRSAVMKAVTLESKTNSEAFCDASGWCTQPEESDDNGYHEQADEFVVSPVEKEQGNAQTDVFGGAKAI